jgi:hypothetical protein
MSDMPRESDARSGSFKRSPASFREQEDAASLITRSPIHPPASYANMHMTASRSSPDGRSQASHWPTCISTGNPGAHSPDLSWCPQTTAETRVPPTSSEISFHLRSFVRFQHEPSAKLVGARMYAHLSQPIGFGSRSAEAASPPVRDPPQYSPCPRSRVVRLVQEPVPYTSACNSFLEVSRSASGPQCLARRGRFDRSSDSIDPFPATFPPFPRERRSRSPVPSPGLRCAPSFARMIQTDNAP